MTFDYVVSLNQLGATELVVKQPCSGTWYENIERCKLILKDVSSCQCEYLVKPDQVWPQLKGVCKDASLFPDLVER